MAQRIKPIGKKVGKDKQGNVIYQVQANGIKIGYKLIGKGEPILMIMGMGSSMERWPSLVVEALSKKYQLILIDNRGIGYSTVDEKKFTSNLLADDCIALLDALTVKKTHLFGISMGGIIAQKILLEYPERINKVILASTTINGKEVADLIKDKIPKNSIAERQLKATLPWKTPLDKFSRITHPVLIITGTSDATVGIESSKTLATTIPGAWLVQFAKGSHLVVGEVPIEFSKAILAFLDIKQSTLNQ